MNLPLPALTWLRTYQPAWLRGDVVAGATLAAYLLPAAIGDASLARLPPEAGLYACLFSGLVYWLFCDSRLTAVSVTSAISLLLGTTLGGLSDGNAARFASLAAATAMLVAFLAFIAWLVKAGALVIFISESVMTGFKCGVGLFLASSQLPKLFGFPGAHGGFWEQAVYFVRHLGETNPASLLVGAGALAVLILGKVLLPHRPVGLLVVIGGILAGAWMGLKAHGVALLGNVPPGLPTPGLPPGVSWTDLNDLLPTAFACFLLGAVETAAIGRMFAARQGERFDANREFLALAVGNLAAGLGRGFPISGGTSQSLVNASGGARTPVSGLVAALILLLAALFLSGTLQTLPQPVVAAIVLFAVAGLVQVSTVAALWRRSRSEFVVALAALVGVLASGLLRGVLIGAVISLVLMLGRVSRPHVAFLGRIPGTRRFSDLQRHTDNQPVPGALLFRVESSLFYFNAEFVRDTVLEKVRAAAERPKLVICDLSTSPAVDLAAAHMLGVLHNDLDALGVGLRVVEAHGSVRDLLRAEGLDSKIGPLDRRNSLADAVEDFQANGVHEHLPAPPTETQSG